MVRSMFPVPTEKCRPVVTSRESVGTQHYVKLVLAAVVLYFRPTELALRRQIAAYVSTN